MIKNLRLKETFYYAKRIFTKLTQHFHRQLQYNGDVQLQQLCYWKQNI
jgi:hypothetical protein